ncbi:zinc-dependent alcohol dehydrogenase [Propionibacterium australiense]|uniref:Alcohol dehydrogenase n=1 Tax=Propionibacterium australiense TaxID=119981 RepID=A0A8B3FS20_9ACTN|nr:alcohol dehydrogenase catalytic domain-containing protein [Propionibacterium australiense]RLP09056.1 alcohol dehydrogenase [Propionibacterium australiense]
MKVAHVTKIGSLRDPDPATRGAVGVLDIPEHPLGDEDVRIKVAYCSICGSDPHLVEGIFGTDVPIGLGHELSGVITELGPKATRKGLKVGDRVAGNFLRFCGTCYYCQNGQQQFCTSSGEYNRPGMAENIVWHESQAYKLPDDVPLRKGALLEPTSVAVRIADKAAPRIGERVVICGGGPIGLLSLQVLKMMGATDLTLIEPIADRRELAEQYGADHTIDPTSDDVAAEAMKLTGGLGYDIVIDCSGSVHGIQPLPEIAAYGARLIFGAMYPGDYEFGLNIHKYCYLKELTITGLFVSPYAYPRAAQILPRMNLDALTEKVFELDDTVAAFEAQVSGRYPKILIRCNQIEGE